MTAGTFSDSETQGALLRLAARRGVGTMIVQAKGDVLTVAFDQGRIVSADLNEPFEEGFGRELVSQELLSDLDVAQIGHQELRSQSQVIDHLLNRGIVPVDELLEALRSYVIDLVVRAISWEGSEYTFFDAEAAPRREGFDPISVEELLVRASEGGGGPLHAVVPLLGSTVYSRVSELSAQRDAARESLSNLELAVLKGVDGKTPARDYERRLNLNPYRIRFALHHLLAAGVIEALEQTEVEQVLADLLEEPSGVLPAPDFGDKRDVGARSTGLRSLLRLPLKGGVGDQGWRHEVRELFHEVSAGWSFALGALLAIGLLGAVLSGNSRGHLFYPLPWQNGPRLEALSVQRASTYRRIERAVSTYQLVNGGAPQELEQLVEAGLLSPDDLFDPTGEWIVYAPLVGGYTLEPEAGVAAIDGTVATFHTLGNFLLDPSYAEGEAAAQREPLLLLD